MKKILLFPLRVLFILVLAIVGSIIWVPTSILKELKVKIKFIDALHEASVGMLLFVALLFIYREWS